MSVLKSGNRNNVTKGAGNVLRVQRRTHAFFFPPLMQPGEEYWCQANGSPDEILLICFTHENRKMYP
jgi:hypothetical protein